MDFFFSIIRRLCVNELFKKKFNNFFKNLLTILPPQYIIIKSVGVKALRYGILAQLGEHLPYKQRVTGSSPVGPIYSYADVAQLAEQLICNQQVIGSSPIIGFYTISYCIYGQIPEWPKGTDCKSAANCFGGSNPPLPILLIED